MTDETLPVFKTTGAKEISRWNWLVLLTAFFLPVPWIIIRLSGWHLDATTEVLLTGLAILGAGFLCSWAGELAQFDISRSLAMAGLAIITVLPEYAVDLYLAWKAGRNPEFIAYAAANMTGANRLLIGIGWSLTVILSMIALRRQRKLSGLELPLEKEQSLEVFFLGLATLYSLLFFVKRNIAIYDAVILSGLFVCYLWAVSKAPLHEPEPVGPVALLSRSSVALRRIVLVTMLIWGGFSIFIATEPFAEGLISIGKRLGVEEFLLIQWVAPLASEFPEIIIVSYFAWRGITGAAMTAIISSKVNQWTLLVGSLSLIYTVSSWVAGETRWALPLQQRPHEELFLTTAQSLFAVAVISNLKITLGEAFTLFILFIIQPFFPKVESRYWFSGLYFGLALTEIIRYRYNLLSTLQTAFLVINRHSQQEVTKMH